MYSFITTTTALSLLPAFFTSTYAFPSTPFSLHSRAPCENLQEPYNLYEISEDPLLRDNTGNRGPFSSPGASDTFSFYTAQNASTDSKRDLIASFKNVRCPGNPTSGSGPYTIRFDYDATAGVDSVGNTLIDVYAINGALPTQTVNGVTTEDPTWNNMGAQTGSLLGSFTFPVTGSPAASQTQLFDLATVACESTINLRFSIASDNSAPGAVTYAQVGYAGLQLHYGC